MYLIVENFKFGLDSRKSELTSNPGSLVTANNGHINQGGEFETRKAFVFLGTLPRAMSLGGTVTNASNASPIVITSSVATGVATGDYVTVSGVLGNLGANVTTTITVVDSTHFSLDFTAGTGAYTSGGVFVLSNKANQPSKALLDCYGLQPTSTGLLTFASQKSTVNNQATNALPAFPIGVTHQRLQHFINPATDPGATIFQYPYLTGVSASCSFNGKAFVVSTFAGGQYATPNDIPASSQLHYDGTAIAQYALGTVWNPLGTGAFLAYLLQQNFSQYFSSDLGYSIVEDGTTPSRDYITGPQGVSFSLAASDTDGVANITAAVNTPIGLQIAAVAAIARFDITVWSGTGTLTVQSPNIPTQTLVTNAPFTSSLELSTINLVKLINGSGTGYSANYTVLTRGVGGVATVRVNIAAPLSYGVTPNALSLVLTSGGATCTTANNTAFSGGVSGVDAIAQISSVDFTNAWSVGSTWTLVLTAEQLSYTLGAGNITGKIPTFCAAFGNRLFFVENTTFHFSKIGDATRWEDQDTGAGDVTVYDRFSDPTNLVALSTYQGKLAVFGRFAIEIWSAPADPTQFSQTQILQNIGTLAKLSVQPIGDLDVLFLSDTGIRSLRVRDSSLNAFVSDIGAPIDGFISDALLTAGDNTTACGIVEPSANRYWLYLKGKIYVLSYFPSSKIVAWSTYDPTYESLGAALAAGANYVASALTQTLVVGTVYYASFGAHETSMTDGTNVLTTSGYFVAKSTTATWTGTGATVSFTGSIKAATQNTFIPEKFVVYNGQVYMLCTDGKVLVYGGTGNSSYDSSIATLLTPWMDAKKPGHIKMARSLDVVTKGQWSVYAGMDMKGGTLDQTSGKGNSNSPLATTDSTVEAESFPFQTAGTHVQLKAVSVPGTPSSALTFSRFIFHYQEGNEKS